MESKNNFLELIVDENGEGILNLNQGEKFIVSCYINNEAFQFEEAIFTFCCSSPQVVST